MKIKVLSLLIFFMMIPFSLYSQGKFNLKTEVVTDATSRLSAISQRYSMAIKEKPPSVKDAPKVSDKAFYYNIQLCGKDIYLVIDYNVTNPPLYIDTNADGKLDDEKPITGTDMNNRTRYMPVKIKPAGASEINIGIDTPKGGGYIYYFPSEIKRGDVKFGNETFSLMIIDRNYNRRYNDFSKDVRGLDYDCIGIDLNRNGMLDSSVESDETSPLAEAVFINGDYYSIIPSADGNSVEIKTIKPATGTLDVQNADMEISTYSRWGAQTLTGSNGKWKLPEGKYTTRLIRLKKKDEKGREWILTSYSFYDSKLASFDITSGKTTVIPAGAPLKIKTTAIMRDDFIEISASFLGRAGEQYSSGPVIDGQRPEPPKFKIVDRDNKELVSGAFQYG